jgi:hypothetical protein
MVGQDPGGLSRKLGNAVPSLIAEIIGREIKRQFSVRR